MRGETGEGYIYIRDRVRGNDVTVYLHQLALIRKGHTVGEVFDPQTEAHHKYPIKEWNEPENVELVDVIDHSRIHSETFTNRRALGDGGRSE